MKPILSLSILGAIVAGLLTAQAQDANEVEALRQELKTLREQARKLEQRIDALASQQQDPDQPEVSPEDVEAAEEILGDLPEQPAEQPPATAPRAVTPFQPRFGTDRAYIDLSLSGLIDAGWATTPDVGILEPGGHDPVQRGFSLPNTELAISGAVDPYFRAFGNAVLLLDEESETRVEMEEAFLVTTSLPANLELKAGQFLAEFGRHNTQHAHLWDFVDQPLVISRLLGPDGVRNPGARLSWLAPTPFYSELYLGVFNGAGETAFSFRNEEQEEFFGRRSVERQLHGADDLLFVPRAAVSFELTDTQTLLFGASGAFGPNTTGRNTDTQVYGVDGYWKWKPERAVKGFPFVSFQSEALYRRFEAGADPMATPALPRETLNDWGLYSQLLWGIKPRWVAGLRGEYVTGDSGAFDAPIRQDRYRGSPNLTWYPSEFSKIRLQYNYDYGDVFEHEHAVWLQLEFFLGSHPAHTF